MALTPNVHAALLDPRTVGWEKAALGTALADPQAMQIAEPLVPADFAVPGHQALWAEMLHLHRRDALELRALIEALRSSNQLNLVRPFDAENPSGEAYIADLVSYRGNVMTEYVDQVMNASVKRSLLQVSGFIAADARDERVPAAEALEEAERRLMALRRGRSEDNGTRIAEILNTFVLRTDAFRAGTMQPAWTPKLVALRRKLRFVEAEDYILVAARPGEGKSSLIRYEFFNAGMPVLIFNLENSEIEYARYAISMVAGIDSDRLKDPRVLEDWEVGRVKEVAQELSRMPVIVKTMGAPSIPEIDRITRHHIQQDQIRMVAIDYIQLVSNGKQKKVDDVTMSSQGARAMALRYGIPVVAAAQLSREIEHRGDDGIPKLSDLRESGSLEQDATIVIFPRRLWANPTDHQLRRFPENVNSRSGQLLDNIKAIPQVAHVLKNRNGPTGTTEPWLWVKSTNNYRTLTNVEE